MCDCKQSSYGDHLISSARWSGRFVRTASLDRASARRASLRASIGDSANLPASSTRPWRRLGGGARAGPPPRAREGNAGACFDLRRSGRGRHRDAWFNGRGRSLCWRQAIVGLALAQWAPPTAAPRRPAASPGRGNLVQEIMGGIQEHPRGMVPANV